MQRTQPGRLRRLISTWWLRILLLLIPFIPHGLWRLEPSTPLNVFVMDKTVPTADWREHAGLFWVLSHHKVTTAEGRLYDPETDYWGYHPGGPAGDTDLVPAQHLDLIYVADTYGVYSEDLAGNPGGERSRLLYGGLQREEWSRLWDAKGPDITLIMEFNAIASPTARPVRALVETDMRVAWTGWIGRYFPDLASPEVPVWMLANYEKQYGAKWTFTGPGVAFVDEADRVVVLDRREVAGMVTFNLTEAGKAHYPQARTVPYSYWFDVIVPDPDLIVEATYGIQATDSGREKMRQFGIPLEFPAIVRHPEGNTYYFAGDYADKPTESWFRYRGAPWFMATFVTRSEDMFYWRAYVPIMSAILADIQAARP